MEDRVVSDMPQWPPLGGDDAKTIATLHLFSQVIGKVPTALLPWRNHSWHLTLHLTPRGLTTEPIHAPGGTFTLALDLADGLVILEDRTLRREEQLGGLSVAAFYALVMTMLEQAGHRVAIRPRPNEIDPATAFAEDCAPRIFSHDSAGRLLAALTGADRVLRYFRTAFLGKVSPVHFFWGSFDMAVTRFSGRRAPRHPGGIPNLPDAVTREAYSHEVSSAGFWPGGAGGPGGPFFYSYAYPAPAGFDAAPVQPSEARYDSQLGEFVLDYEIVRRSANPDDMLLSFFQSTYEAAARLAHWDRDELECGLGQPGIPRAV
jgi:hypothetical protein